MITRRCGPSLASRQSNAAALSPAVQASAGPSSSWQVKVTLALGSSLEAARMRVTSVLDGQTSPLGDWVMVTAGPGKAAERANSRRKDWWRLPYGVPLCVGFVGYLAFDLYRFVAAGQ